ncbi:MAG: hypothetical protein COT14_00495 [Candidatus Diapherotrites archaeon CG08_land_8_20_14_0_20_30_16]|nr:MAG: hypothetical protein COT14_00495 [Candidatus Diapherotrites archaeon CG08_land_8_20_14_0_20_30_16]
MNIQEMIDNGLLKVESCSPELINKELEESEKDLKNAKESFEDGNHKWSIIQAYYCIFHIARALIYKKGYREKSHYALYLLLDEFCRKRMLESKYIIYFKAAMYARQDADYDAVYSEDVAKEILDFAIEFSNLKHKL